MPPSSAFLTTEALFLLGDIPQALFNPDPNPQYSDISASRKSVFHRCRVRPWPAFNANAAQVLVGNRSRDITHGLSQTLQLQWGSTSSLNATTEAHITTLNFLNVLQPCNLLIEEGPTDDLRWEGETMLGGNRRCDFALTQGSHINVVGELKKPALDLGPNLTSSWLEQQLRGEFSVLIDKKPLRPFLQCFSYMYESGTGLGILTNYNETRFFRMEISEHNCTIYMSPLVRIDQKLHGNQPHCMQAYLYAMDTYVAEGPLSRKEMRLLKVKQEGLKKTVQKALTKNAKAKSKKRASHAGSSSGGQGVVTHSNNPLEFLALNAKVSRVLEQCEFIRILGEGMTGTIDESWYQGTRVAVKIGRPFRPGHHDDGFLHVGIEVEIYKELTAVQGTYVPRMIAGGFENWHTLASNVLIVEKVGHPLMSTRDELFLDGQKLSHEEAKQILVKSLEALDAVHACGVVHGDPNTDNIRVERNNGKFHVWLLDFGLAEITDSEDRRDRDKISFEDNFPSHYFSNWKNITAEM